MASFTVLTSENLASATDEIHQGVSAVIEEHANVFFKSFADTDYATSLDLSLASIATLDSMIDELWDGDGPSEEGMGDVIRAFAGYLAKLMQQYLDGVWWHNGTEPVFLLRGSGALTGTGLMPYTNMTRRLANNESLHEQWNELTPFMRGSQLTEESLFVAEKYSTDAMSVISIGIKTSFDQDQEFWEDGYIADADSDYHISAHGNFRDEIFEMIWCRLSNAEYKVLYSGLPIDPSDRDRDEETITKVILAECKLPDDETARSDIACLMLDMLTYSDPDAVLEDYPEAITAVGDIAVGVESLEDSRDSIAAYIWRRVHDCGQVDLSSAEGDAQLTLAEKSIEDITQGDELGVVIHT